MIGGQSYQEENLAGQGLHVDLEETFIVIVNQRYQNVDKSQEEILNVLGGHSTLSPLTLAETSG